MGNSSQSLETAKKSRQQRKQSKESPEPINELEIGVPYIENEFWQMMRDSKTRSLSKAFQKQQVDCYQVIVPTSGHTVVHESVVLDRREHLKLCQIYGANWDQGDSNGVTALMKAAALNRVYYIQKLIEFGADISTRDNRGRTAMDYAELYENYQAYDILKEANE